MLSRGYRVSSVKKRLVKRVAMRIILFRKKTIEHFRFCGVVVSGQRRCRIETHVSCFMEGNRKPQADVARVFS